MLNLLRLLICLVISPAMSTYSQTTSNYDEQYSVEAEFIQLLGDSEKDFVSQGTEFISNSMRNMSKESLLPLTLSQYSLLQTFWALSSGRVELAEAYVNKTLFNLDPISEEWLQNFQFDPTLVFNTVKSISRITEGNESLTIIAVLLSRSYNVLIKAAEQGDNDLIIWLKNSGLEVGSEAVVSAWANNHVGTVSLLLDMGVLEGDLVGDVANISNSRGETLLHFAAGRDLYALAAELIDRGALVDQRDVNSLTPLYHAVRANKEQTAEFLLERGADFFIRSQNGNTLLHLAVIDNSTDAVLGLLRLVSYRLQFQREFEIEEENCEKLTSLYLAAERGYDPLIDLLIKNGASANFETSSGELLLHVAANRGSLMAVKSLIKRGAFVNSNNREGLTPLYVAANVGTPDVVRFLLNKGAARHESGDSLLHIAARREDKKAMETLVNLCVPVDVLNEKGITPLYSAAAAGKRFAMEFLLAKGADLYINLSNGLRLLHVAAVNNDVVAIKSLLGAGIYVDVKDKETLTALCRAVQHDNVASVSLLIDNRANSSFRTSAGDTLLHIAAASGSYESIKLLVEHGLSIDAENEQNETPLYVAAKKNKIGIANLLVALGANKNYVTSKGGTLAHLAAVTNDLVALKALFDIGVDFNTVDGSGFPPLYSAIQKSEIMAANIMLEIGVDLFFIDGHDDTLLHIAGRNNEPDSIDFLIDKGLYIDSYGSNGYRPVDIALHEGHCATAEHFINKGANVRGRNGINQTILHSAVIGDCVNFFRNIAVHIYDIDPKDENMQTPLHLAVVQGKVGIAGILVSLGADVNSKDKYNATPFQIAAVNRHWDIVTLFLTKDVNLDWTDAYNRNLLHLATLEKQEYIINYLTRQMRADIYVQDIDGRIPLHLAAEKGFSQIMPDLIDQIITNNIDYKDFGEKTPLHLAAIGGHNNAISYLLSRGADPSAKDLFQQTPLIFAVKNHHWDIASQLLKSGEGCIQSVANSTDTNKRTVLHLAVLDKKVDFISRHKECFKNIIVMKDSNGQTPLDLALSMKNRIIVENLFRYYGKYLKLNDCIILKLAKIGIWDALRTLSSVDSDCRDEDNRTLLHLAALHGEEYTVLFLLKNRVSDIDTTDIDNRTPLHLAAIKNRKDVLHILLKHGARQDIKDRDQMTPLSLALINKSWYSALELLEGDVGLHWTDNLNRTLLHYAAINGQEDIIKHLLKNTKIDLNARDIDLNTPLQLVAAQSNLSSHVKQNIIDNFYRNGADWDILDKQNRSILHLLIISGDQYTLDYILGRYRQSINVNAQDINSQTPLHIAVIKRHVNMVTTLLQYGADKNVLDINQLTPLVYAINNSLWKSEVLLDQFTDIDWFEPSNRSTILHLAAMHGCSRVVEKLLNLFIKKINIDSLDINQQTPLHLAAREDHEYIVDLLLRNGADRYYLDKENRSPFHLAVIRNSWKAVKALLIGGSYGDMRYHDNRTILHLAILDGSRDLIDHIINNNISDPTAADDLGDTPLHVAARKNDSITIKQLLGHGAGKDVVNSIGQNPLTAAMVSENWQAVTALLDGSCDVNGVDVNNRTLLHFAAEYGQRELIDHLVSCRNVNVNGLDKNHETPLDLLLENNYWDIVSSYSYINWRDGRGRTFLHRALSNEYYRDLRALDYFKSSDAVDNQMQTPLHIAAMNDYSDTVDRLISYGASINVVDINGHSPMHLAAMNGHEYLIRKVLGGDQTYNVKNAEERLNIRDILGRTPLQLSLDYGHKETAMLLKKNGGTI